MIRSSHNCRWIISIYATEVPIIARLNRGQSFFDTFEQVWKRSRRSDNCYDGDSVVDDDGDGLLTDRHEADTTKSTVLMRPDERKDNDHPGLLYKIDERLSLDTIVQQKEGAKAHSPYYGHQKSCDDDHSRSIFDRKDSSDQFNLMYIGLVGAISLCPSFISEGDLLSSFQAPLSHLGMMLGGCTSGFPTLISNPISIPVLKNNDTKRLRLTRQRVKPLVIDQKEENTRETMRMELELELERTIRDSINCRNIRDLKLSRQRLTRFIDAKKASEGDKIQMKTFMKAQLQKKYGKVNERSAIKHYEYVMRKKVFHENKTIFRIFHTKGGDVDFIIKGRIDGLTEDGRIIEIKSRTRSFHDTLPDHEKAQLQTYLFLCNKNYGEIVQYLNNGKRQGRTERQTIKITPVQRDEKYFEEFILPHLTVFVTALDVFLGSANLKKQYSQKPTKREEIVNSLLIHAQALNCKM